MQEYELVRDLDHYPCPVACVGVSSFSAAVGHVFQNGEAFLYDVVVFGAVYIDDQPDAARIVLPVLRVQTPGLQ